MSEFWRLVDGEFGAGYGRTLVREQVLQVLGDQTAEQAVAGGAPPREVWFALCAALDVPPERRWGREPRKRTG